MTPRVYVTHNFQGVDWVRAPREAEKPYLLASVRDLPELGRLTGRGDTLNLERLVAAKFKDKELPPAAESRHIWRAPRDSP